MPSQLADHGAGRSWGNIRREAIRTINPLREFLCQALAQGKGFGPNRLGIEIFRDAEGAALAE